MLGVILCVSSICVKGEFYKVCMQGHKKSGLHDRMLYQYLLNITGRPFMERVSLYIYFIQKYDQSLSINLGISLNSNLLAGGLPVGGWIIAFHIAFHVLGGTFNLGPCFAALTVPALDNLSGSLTPAQAESQARG